MREFFQAFGESPEAERVLKASLISMSDSVVNPRTVEPEALGEVLGITHEKLPRLKSVSLETRADVVSRAVLNYAAALIQGLWGGVQRELAFGVETASETHRLAVGKGVTDSVIIQTCRMAREYGWSVRMYFTHNLIERRNRVNALKKAVDFVEKISGLTRVQASMLVIRGYKPEKPGNPAFFEGFKDMDDAVALAELGEAAAHAKARGVMMEVDSTSEDQASQNAVLLPTRYAHAVDAYNRTLDSGKLTLF